MRMIMSNFPVLNKKATQLCENEYKIATGFDDKYLMELSGFSSAKEILNFCGPLDDDHLVIFAGPGKNGGDGLAAAYFLAPNVKKITICMPSPSKISYVNDNLERIKKFCTNIEFTTDIVEGDVYIDALFGTGFNQKTGFENVVKFLNQQPNTVIAIDLPSGLDADGEITLNDTVKPDLTIAVGCLKPAHQSVGTAFICGDLVCADIGLPYVLLQKYQDSQKIAC